MNDSCSEATTWVGDRAERWVRMADGLERQLAPVSEVLFGRAALDPGERVLDVGCGTGPTTRHAASLVGPSGAVTGIDISADMLAAASAMPASAGSAPIDWIEADVVTWSPEIVPVDVVLSRFGVMFFDDPAAAFANLRRVAAPGGRLHVAVWAERPESAMFELPLSVALDLLSAWDVEVDVPSPVSGPFSLCDPEAVRSLLGGAGWTEVSCERHALRLPLGGGLPPAEAASVSMELGPARIVTEDLDEARRDEVHRAIARAYEDRLEDGHVVLDATVMVVSARA